MPVTFAQQAENYHFREEESVLKHRELTGAKGVEEDLAFAPVKHMLIALQRRARATVMQAGNEANHGGPGRNPGKEEMYMKLRILSFLAVATLILGCAFLVSTHAAPNKTNTPATPSASALPATPAAATPAEPHPQIREALGALRRAKEHMEHAAHDFGGHRVEALKATDEAINQLEICLKYDKD